MQSPIKREVWGPPIDVGDGPRGESARPLKPQGIVIHHTEENADFNHCPHELCLARLRHWSIFHRQVRGWSDIGYHALVCHHGNQFEGRKGGVVQPIEGAHALGNNDRALGIALLGYYQEEAPSTPAMTTLRELVEWCCAQYAIDPAGAISWKKMQKEGKGIEITAPTIIGHRDVRETVCPGNKLYALLNGLRSV